ncbi:MAG: permease [Bacillota bacterium]|nr:permease [Bacillota bacterium]MDW7730432.1 permease [Bacillota bacterium]
MNKTTMGMATAALILIIIAFIQGGFLLVSRGFIIAGEKFIGVFLILIIAFIVAGFVSILVPQKLVSRWLGKEAGWKGPFLGSLLGAMVPGGPFFFYPLMAALTVSGANVGTMISFVAAKTLWNFARLPVEIAFVGVELTVIRFLITFPIPILAGTAVDIFLPGFADKIRDDIKRLQLKRTQKCGDKID